MAALSFWDPAYPLAGSAEFSLISSLCLYAANSTVTLRFSKAQLLETIFSMLAATGIKNSFSRAKPHGAFQCRDPGWGQMQTDLALKPGRFSDAPLG